MLRSFMVVALLVLSAGCSAPSTQTEAESSDVEPGADSPVDELIRDSMKMTKCRTLRVFLDFDREKTVAALPEGFVLTESALDPTTASGLLHVTRCETLAGAPEEVLYAMAGVSVQPRDHANKAQFGADLYRFDMLVGTPALAETLGSQGFEVAEVEMSLEQDLYGFVFSATGKGYDWSGVHVRPEAEEQDDTTNYEQTERWHAVARVHGWIDESPDYEGFGGIPFNVGRTVPSLEGGTTPGLLTPGRATALYSLDYGGDLWWRTAMVNATAEATP